MYNVYITVKSFTSEPACLSDEKQWTEWPHWRQTIMWLSTSARQKNTEINGSWKKLPSHLYFRLR